MNYSILSGLSMGVFALASAAFAAPVNLVAYGSAGPNIVDFEDVAGAAFPGVNYDGILSTGGVQIAERFVGQTLSFSGDLDVLSGGPTGPLTLQVGDAGDNLAVGTDFGDNGLYPCGGSTCINPGGYGEGSFAMLFGGGVSKFGFQSTFGGGSVFVDIFNSAGGLIDSIAAAGGGFVGFERDGGTQDIFGFSAYTNDAGGLGYQEFRYGNVKVGPSPVPLPASLPLLASVLGLVGFWKRRRKAI